jgi:hypothetical protein
MHMIFKVDTYDEQEILYLYKRGIKSSRYSFATYLILKK